MKNDRATRIDGLHDIVDQKITAIVREMEDADWSAYDVALAIDGVVKKRWLGQARALREAREAMPKNFVSDGNEG